MISPDQCGHLQLDKLASGNPANRLHVGPESAYYCHGCGSTFFVLLKPAEITVTHGRPQK